MMQLIFWGKSNIYSFNKAEMRTHIICGVCLSN